MRHLGIKARMLYLRLHRAVKLRLCAMRFVQCASDIKRGSIHKAQSLTNFKEFIYEYFLRKVMLNRKVAGAKLAIIFAIIFFFSLLSGAKAIGITPARYTLDFQPNMEGDIEFCAINNEQKNLPIEIYVKGDLQQYVTLRETKATLTPLNTKQCFSAHYKLPADISGGHHDTRIGVLESLPAEVAGTGVAARLGAELQFWVEAPVPGKLVRATINIPETVLVGQSVPVRVILKNDGKEAVKVKVVIEIIDKTKGETVSRMEGPEIALNTQETKEDNFTWAGTKVPGEYRVKATLFYDGIVKDVDKEFIVGGLFVRINKLKVSEIKKGGIQKIPIELQSFWNEKIDNVFAELNISGADGVAASGIKTDVININALETGTLTAFWDTTDIQTGVYNVTVKAFYRGESSTASFKLKVVRESALGSGVIRIALIIGVVAILLVVFGGIIYANLSKKRG